MRTAAVVAMAATILLLASITPTFDFDEALYRRIAEEMKQSHEWSTPTWDGRPFYEKPPTYIWSIVAASALVDRDAAHVSVLAARLPSAVCSFVTIALLSWFWRRRARDYASTFGTENDHSTRWLFSPLLPALAYGTGLFAIGGSATVMLDPMLTMFLAVPLLMFSAAWLRRAERLELTMAESIAAGLAMAAATTVKGLVGIVLPALALVVHAALVGPRMKRIRETAMAASRAFAIALAGAGVAYAAMYRLAGAAFFREFFIRQHLIRATSPIQGHRGPFFFHLAIILLIGGPLVAFVLRLLPRRGSGFARWGFPLTWSLTVIAFYSALATKLPNYTWPVWPALAMTLCILLMRGAAVDAAPAGRSARAASYLCLVPVILMTAAIGTGADRLVSVHNGPRSQAMTAAFDPVPLAVRAAFVAIAIILVVEVIAIALFGHARDRRSPFVWRSIAATCVMNCAVLALIVVVIVPFVDDALRGPLIRLSHDASADHLAGGDLTTIGLFSPTVSSSYDGGRLLQVGHVAAQRPTAGQHLRLAPSWRADACAAPAFVVVRRDHYVMLCVNRR
ncbi:MAG TPA: hypothetical protein VLU46_10500 [Thermoanaerobaculia bacterium]|nr:hypothetical protein [Thermoanaerobaculia bacterium]